MTTALSQYLELYRENAGVIDAHSGHLMNAARREAAELLSADGARLPIKRDEGWERTSLEDMFAPDYGVNVNRVDLPVEAAASFRCAVPRMSTLLGVTANDAFRLAASALPEGVTFMPLAEACRRFPDIVGRHYGKIMPATANSAVALNTLLAQDGVFIHVADGVHPRRPLQLVNIFSAATPLMAVRRVLIVVGDGGSLQLLSCDHTQQPGNAYLSSQVVEIALGRDASLDLCDIEESSAETSRYSATGIRQAAGSRLNHATVTLTCGKTRNDICVDLTGDNASTYLAGMAIGDATMHVDNNTLVSHRAQRCKSNQLFKYVLEDEATGAFEGSIVVADGAKYTEAYQSNRNILASQGARMHTKPQLEIYNDDVKCSHGATTGQLDEKALFYMQQRGIPRGEARDMLMQAFMVDVIDSIVVEGLRDRLRHLVENRFKGAGSCGDCINTCRQ